MNSNTVDSIVTLNPAIQRIFSFYYKAEFSCSSVGGVRHLQVVPREVLLIIKIKMRLCSSFSILNYSHCKFLNGILFFLCFINNSFAIAANNVSVSKEVDKPIK